MVQFIEGQLSPRSKFAQSFGQSFASSLDQRLQLLAKQNEAQKTLQMLGLGAKPTVEQRLDPEGTEGNQPVSPEQQQQGIGAITPEQVIGASVIGNKDLSSALGDVYKTQQKASAKQEERAYQASTEAIKGATTAKKDLQGRKMSLNVAKQGIISGDDSKFRAWLAEASGHPELKDASWGAVDAAAKTHLITSLSQIQGGRPNQFLEGQIAKAFALPGGSKEANLAKIELQESLADMEEILADNILQMAEKYDSKGMPVPGNIGRAALKEALPGMDKRQKVTSYKIQDLIEPREGTPGLMSIKKVPKGTPLTEKKARVVFEKANPGKAMQQASDEEIERATKLAEDLGYDLSYFDLVQGIT